MDKIKIVITKCLTVKTKYKYISYKNIKYILT